MSKGDLLDKLPVQPIPDGPPGKLELATVDATPLADTVPPADVTQITLPERTMMDLLSEAVSNPKIDPAKMRELYEIKRMIDRDQAERDFTSALVAFQADCKKMPRTKRVANKDGTTRYWYAELGPMQEFVKPVLATHGFMYDWSTERVGDHSLRCVLTLSHKFGHSRQYTSDGPIDAQGQMTAIQKFGSGYTYLYRRTLVQALGLITHDPDADGADPEAPTEPDTPISRDCIDTINDLLKQKGYRTDGERDKFFKWLTTKCRTPVTSTDTIPETQYDFCVDELNRMTDAT